MNAGITNFACFKPTLSAMVNPLSAITMSPGNKCSKNPQFSVKYLSEVRPPHASDKKHASLRGNTNDYFYSVVFIVVLI